MQPRAPEDSGARFPLWRWGRVIMFFAGMFCGAFLAVWIYALILIGEEDKKNGRR